MARIIYPKDSEGIFKLFNSVLKKHLEDGKDSALNNYDLNTFKVKNDKGEEAHREANRLAEESQKKREERNLLQGEIDALLHKMGNYLKSIYVETPRKLSDWGYSIDDSPKGSGSSEAK